MVACQLYVHPFNVACGPYSYSNSNGNSKAPYCHCQGTPLPLLVTSTSCPLCFCRPSPKQIQISLSLSCVSDGIASPFLPSSLRQRSRFVRYLTLAGARFPLSLLCSLSRLALALAILRADAESFLPSCATDACADSLCVTITCSFAGE